MDGSFFSIIVKFLYIFYVFAIGRWLGGGYYNFFSKLAVLSELLENVAYISKSGYCSYISQSTTQEPIGANLLLNG